MKVYLSPSNQTENSYAYAGTNEGVQCGRIAEACKAALARSGVGVMLGHMKSMQEKVQESNSYGADLHVCIHTNAFNGQVSGTRMFCFNENGNGMKACKAIFNRLAPITPGTSENIRVNAKLYEVRVPAAPTAYIEVDFHDVPSVAQWIVENVNLIGETIAQGICEYFGVAYKPPVTDSKEGVLYKVQVGAFAIRSNAEKMLTRLKAAGFDGYIKEEKKES